MTDIPNYYTLLFNRVTDAIKALEQQNYGTARDILVKAQQEAEELYIEAGEAPADQGDKNQLPLA